MTHLVLGLVFAVLVLNLLTAAVVCARRGMSGNWLLVILLAGTTGAAAAAVLGVLAGEPRFIDVALVLTGTAAVTAAVRGLTIRTAVQAGGAR
ncbi:hypothetical protein [Nesterenkonia alba]|uniref:hypothetical protein n=1 Tax=Nesterenkonia alba TaxID=515814 RepID=UPI0003B424AF|nr:hypothetical protein [Nesterenkonia alba]